MGGLQSESSYTVALGREIVLQSDANLAAFAAPFTYTRLLFGWLDDICGGGIWWSKENKYKNAIANELFLSVAAHLANRSSSADRRQYLNWGNREWAWFAASVMINSKNLINDGLGKTQGQMAGPGWTNNGQTTWIYNQGVILGGLAELSAVNPDPSVPVTAQKIATATITLLVDSQGVLHDSCEPNCGGYGSQFKGNFVRNLVLLDKTYPQPAYKAFVDTNAAAIGKTRKVRTFSSVRSGQDLSTPATHPVRVRHSLYWLVPLPLENTKVKPHSHFESF